MKIFIRPLFLTLMIFLNYIQSINIDNEVVHVYRGGTEGRSDEIVQGRTLQPNPEAPQAGSSRPTAVQINDGDIVLYRDSKPFGKVQGRKIYEINPVQHGQPRIVHPEIGDVIMYAGIPIAKYYNGWRRVNQPQITN